MADAARRDADADGRPQDGRVTRRGFLRGSGAVAAVTAAGVVGAGCDPFDDSDGVAEQEPVEGPERREAAQRDALEFFNPHQGATVDAIAGRILPGDASDPGAREAGVVFYIDHLLSTHAGYAEKTYTKGPYAQAYEGDEPPDDEGSVIWVPAEEIERYGWQSPLVPRQIYEMGLARLDALADARFGGDFVDLADEQQDELLAAIEDDEADDVESAFGDLSAADFFSLVRKHTLQGFLADPLYGGNRDMVGWHLIGFAGARRQYSPEDMFDEDFTIEPQSLLDLPTFHAHHDEEDGEALITVRKRHPNGPRD